MNLIAQIGVSSAVVLALIGVVWWMFRRQRKQGYDEAVGDMEAETNRQVQKGEKIAREVEDMSDDAVQQELKDKWSRKS